VPESRSEEARAGARQWSRELRFAVLVAVALGALVVLHAALNHGLPSPQIQADEGGYLGNARYMVSGYGRSESGYYAGYSLFLVPAALVTHAATTLYHAALLVNAGLSVLAPLLALVLVRQLFESTPRWVSLIAAGLVAFSPLVFSFAGLAMSENALVPVVLAIAVLLARAARDGSLRFVGLASATAAFAYWVSPRGLVIAAVTLVAVAILAWDLRRYLTVLGTGAAVIAVGLGLGQLFETAVKGTGTVAGVSNRRVGLQTLFDPSIWHRWLAATLGGFSYIGAASAGITVIGLAVAVGWSFSRRPVAGDPARRVHRCVGAFAFAAPVVTLVASAGGFASHGVVKSLDFWYYGRYTEAVAMPALAIGAAWLLSATPRIRVARGVVIAGAAIALVAIAVPVLDNQRSGESSINRLNVLGLLTIHSVFRAPTITYQLLLGAAFAVSLGLLMAWRAWIFGLFTVALLAASALHIQASYLAPASAARKRQTALADAVRVLEDNGVSADCIEPVLERIQLPLPPRIESLRDPRARANHRLRPAHHLVEPELRQSPLESATGRHRERRADVVVDRSRATLAERARHDHPRGAVLPRVAL
jgi:hypothetical protein